MQKTGVKFKFLPMPIFRLYKEFIDGNIDFKFPDSVNWQSEMKKNKNIIYSDDVITYIDGIVMKNENKNMTISEIKTIGTIRGFELKEYKNKNKNIKFLESNNISELIDDLYKEKIDAVYFNVAVALHVVNNNVLFKNKFLFRKDLPYVLDHYKISTIKNKILIDDFNNFLKNNNKEIMELRKKNGIIH
jgi:ABC-type amino acid transport substrate-binding protein